MDKVRYRIIFSGRVQGVGFRYRSKYAAEGYGVTGWVRNEPDGTVLMEAQGSWDQINDMLKLIHQSAYIMIENVDRQEMPVNPKERGFHIR
ncbi:MAG: acylphosphatase [Lachnospiraceae bacterium]|nr:acylphosphatase [Lachnospiraceae bacterium]